MHGRGLIARAWRVTVCIPTMPAVRSWRRRGFNFFQALLKNEEERRRSWLRLWLQQQCCRVTSVYHPVCVPVQLLCPCTPSWRSFRLVFHDGLKWGIEESMTNSAEEKVHIAREEQVVVVDKRDWAQRSVSVNCIVTRWIYTFKQNAFLSSTTALTYHAITEASEIDPWLIDPWLIYKRRTGSSCVWQIAEWLVISDSVETVEGLSRSIIP